jgi:hypothetical protein
MALASTLSRNTVTGQVGRPLVGVPAAGSGAIHSLGKIHVGAGMCDQIPTLEDNHLWFLFRTQLCPLEA